MSDGFEPSTLFIRDNVTGEFRELPSGTTHQTPEQKQFIKDRIAFKEELERMRRATNSFKSDKCGEFFWSLYAVNQDYHPNVPDDMLVKIIYLLTYLDYKKNMLVTRQSASDAYRPMKKDDVQKAIRLHKCKFPTFWNKLLASGIISENEYGELIVSKEFRRGSLDKRSTKGMAAMKMFSRAIRYMYENTDVRTHRYLAYLYRLIPYINLKFNVLCDNSLETDKQKIRLLTANELCELVGIESRRDNEDRLINALFKLMFFDKSGKKWSVITVIKRIENDKMCQYITINPLFYAGYISQDDMVDILDEFVIKERENETS